MPSQWSINWCGSDFNSVWSPLPSCLPKCRLKGEFLDSYLTTSFRVGNFGNTSAVRVIYFCKCSEFNLAFKNAAINSENIFCFWDNCIWIGSLKLSLLRRQYLSLTVNMLTNILKTLRVTKRDFFKSIPFTVINKYGKGGAVQISRVFGPPWYVASQRVLRKGTF